MKNMKQHRIGWITTAAFLSICVSGLNLCAQQQEKRQQQPGDMAKNAADANSRAQVQSHAQSDIERQRKEAEQQVEKSLDSEAVAAIEETRKAIDAIEQSNINEAIAAIERATGKINIMVARDPAVALLPVAFEVEVIEAAPLDVKVIREIAEAAEEAVEDKDYPAARTLLHGLTSEIRVRTAHLPLATYPVAMQEAAALLAQNKPEEAKTALTFALHTMVVIDRVTPLPLAIARMAISDAEGLRDQDKEAAKRLLSVAKTELERAKELGYAGKDAEYVALNDAIEGIDRQLDGGQDTASAFTKLKEKIASFFKRQSESEKKSEVAQSG